MTMIERVARVLCPIDPDSDTEWVSGNRWYRLGVPHWKSWVEEARAVVTAMNEPTQEMVAAVYDADPPISAVQGHALPEDDLRRLYSLMLGAAE